MRRFTLLITACLLPALIAPAQSPNSGPYKIVKKVKAGGVGGFDYVYADEAGRKLYVPRTGNPGRITVFDLDTLETAGEIPNVSAHGAAVSPKSHYGFSSSKPVAMWDSKTLAMIKTIDVEGAPDGILYEPVKDQVWIFSHRAPNATVINAADGSIAKTIDLGGAPEQAVSDGKGHLYVDLEDKDNIAVVDTNTFAVTAHYDLGGKGGTCAGLAMDLKNRVLFASCRKPQNMVILKADDGTILTALPIGMGTDGAAFNPKTMEAFSSQGDGTLTIIKEESPSSFVVEQNLETMRGAKTLTLDTKTNRVLLIAAEYGPAPATPAPGGRPGRGPMVPDSFTILVAGK